MYRVVLHSCVGVALSASVAGISSAQPNPAPVPPPATAASIDENGYVRLEVVLRTTSADKVITFHTACPKQPLFGIDLQQLMSGSDHVTLGVGITAPGLAALELTPVSIDKKSSGFLGLGKSCDVTIDQIRYLSPAYYVRSYENQQFTVAPAFKETQAANPALATTIDTALNVALPLAGIPAATAQPYEQQVTNVLGQVGVAVTEQFPKHPVIKPGTVPADTDFEWKTSGLLTPKNGAPIDVDLIARLIPVATLIPAPPADANGNIAWQPTDVLSSPFAVGVVPGVGNTLGDYVSAAMPAALANFHGAATKGEASIACDSILVKVQSMGLSNRDQGLLMWAITHDLPPAGVTSFDIDNLHCLEAAWKAVPAAVSATKTPPKPLGAPPSVRQMQAATQIDDALAIFFKTTVWAERRKTAASLFSYPVKYTDASGLLFDSSQQVDNADQWLALHNAATPVANRVGCYTYVSASDPSGKSLMYAVADTVSGKANPQVLLTITFPNVAGNDDAKIDSITVVPGVSPEQKSKILAAQGSQCSSGYKPAIVFGG